MKNEQFPYCYYIQRGNSYKVEYYLYSEGMNEFYYFFVIYKYCENDTNESFPHSFAGLQSSDFRSKEKCEKYLEENLVVILAHL